MGDMPMVLNLWFWGISQWMKRSKWERNETWTYVSNSFGKTRISKAWIHKQITIWNQVKNEDASKRENNHENKGSKEVERIYVRISRI